MFWDWIIIIFLVGFLFYGATKIKSEKNDYENWGRPLAFDDLNLLVPHWWTLTNQTDSLLKFERTDTKYDWFCRFEKKDCDQASTPKSVINNEIKRMQLEFDDGPLVQRDNADLILDEKTRLFFENSFQRIESTATQFGTERAYMDVAVIKHPSWNYYYLLYSWSSVLNGMVEGPFFEEVLKNLKLTQTSTIDS